jgi:flavin reductase (DIM6/NTAB) family NADH-FMN oxidoreductase RutF
MLSWRAGSDDPKHEQPSMTDTTHEIDSRLFRRVMSRFPTGVTVLTVRDGDEMRGMTANAFMSGSLEPPLLVVSVAKRAHTHAFMTAADRFGVNILAETHREVSEHFAGRPSPRLQVGFDDRCGVPLLKDACARMAAKTVARHDCGDHSVFIGHILHMDADERLPLIYHAGRYRGLDQAGRIDQEAVLEFW